MERQRNEAVTQIPIVVCLSYLVCIADIGHVIFFYYNGLVDGEDIDRFLMPRRMFIPRNSVLCCAKLADS